MEWVALASAVIGAVGTYAGGQAQKRQMESQAMMTRLQSQSQALQYRSDALGFQEEAVANLKNTRINLATLNARGASGNLDPYSGSLGNLMTVNLAEGLLDYDTAVSNYLMTRENIKMQREMAGFQAAIYMAAGDTAEMAANIQAGTQLASGGAAAWNAGAFSSTASTPSPYSGPHI